MRLMNKLGYCLMAAIPAVSLAACSSGSSSVQTGPPPEQTSIVIDAVPTADAAGLYIAEDAGYFAQQGLNVKIAPINGDRMKTPRPPAPNTIPTAVFGSGPV